MREASGDVMAAQGRLIQAARLPNPRLAYEEEGLGAVQSSAGSIPAVLSQELLTGGKHRLDKAVARRGLDAASVAMLGRRFDCVLCLRRAYFDFANSVYAAQINDRAATQLQDGVTKVRTLVETGTQLRRDLLRLEALLQDALINQNRGDSNVAAAWRQLAAEIGMPALPMPNVGRTTRASFTVDEHVPQWNFEGVVQRVQGTNTELLQTALEADRARLEFERARAERIPNVGVGGGYVWDFAENIKGGVVTVETALPIWDCKRGLIREAEARWIKAQAAQQQAVNRLHRDTAEALPAMKVPDFKWPT